MDCCGSAAAAAGPASGDEDAAGGAAGGDILKDRFKRPATDRDRSVEAAGILPGGLDVTPAWDLTLPNPSAGGLSAVVPLASWFRGVPATLSEMFVLLC